MMSKPKFAARLLSVILLSPTLSAEQGATTLYPETPSEVWGSFANSFGGYQSKIENDSLNTEIFLSETIDFSFFGDPLVEVQVIRFDLGALTGLDATGAIKSHEPKISALYARPLNGDGTPQAGLPAIVNLHGGGQFPSWSNVYEWASRGYACISINWGGKPMAMLTTQLVDGKSLPSPPVGANYDNTDWDGLAAGFIRGYSNVGGSYLLDTVTPITDPAWDGVHSSSEEVDHEVYLDGKKTLFENVPHPMNAAFNLNSYAARRAITFLAQQPEVDASKIGVLGFSMGGITATITGTDPRIQCLAPAVGGTGWDYEDYYGLPGTRNKSYSGAASTFPLYQCTVSQESYWPLIQVPTLFLNATNDFNAPFDAVQRSIDLLPSSVRGVMVNTPHSNHIPYVTELSSQILWMEQHLKGGFSFPNEPSSSLALDHSSGVPVFTVTPDPNATQTIQEVEIFYGDELFSLERYWHKAIAAETSPGSWQAALPVFDTARPLVAFAKVTYEVGFDVTTALNATHDLFSITSEVQSANAEDNGVNELVANGIVAEQARDRDLTSVDDGLEDWHDYASFGGNFSYGTFKLGAERYQGPDGSALLQLEISSNADPNTNTVAITVGETWGFQTFQLYRVTKTLPVNGVNTLQLNLADFKRVDDGVTPLPSWSSIKLLKVEAAVLTNSLGGYGNWVGGKPDIISLSWQGGAHAAGMNEAPSFSSDKFTKPQAAVGDDYAASLAGDALEPLSDPAPSSILYQKIAGPTWLTVGVDGSLGGSPTANDAGSNHFVIEAQDGAGGRDFAELQIDVVVPTLVIKVEVQANTPGVASWSLPSIPAPSSADYADFSQGNVTTEIPTSVIPTVDSSFPVGEKERVLFDGQAQDNDGYDAATNFLDNSRSLFFDNQPNDGRPNRVLVDLNGPQSVFEVNAYSWHDNIRGNQSYELYYFNGANAPSTDDTRASDADLVGAGWALLASVVTNEDSNLSPQIATSIKNCLPGPLVEATHLLFDFNYPLGDSVAFGTVFGEIDVLTADNYALVDVQEGVGFIPHYWLLANGLDATDTAALTDSDGDGMSAAEEYWAGTNPQLSESHFALLSLVFTEASVDLQWSSVAGKKYQVFRSTDLESWSLVSSEITGTGALTGTSLPADPAQGSPEIFPRVFYRVGIVPER